MKNVKTSKRKKITGTGTIEEKPEVSTPVDPDVQARVKDIRKQLQELQKELMDSRFEFANARSLAKPARVKTIHKNLARLHGELRKFGEPSH